jgi:hypothetical protein
MTPEEREREMETERVRQFTSRVFFMIAVLVFCEYGCHVGSPLLLWLISVLYQLNLPSLRLRHSGACHHSNAVPGMSGYRLPDKPSDPILRMVPTARLLYFSFSTHLQAWNLRIACCNRNNSYTGFIGPTSDVGHENDLRLGNIMGRDVASLRVRFKDALTMGAALASPS